ncbi:catalase [Nocardia otitidiscaviarum]|uniref:catalase n=1 Tax=Nocardia otitidiscaviarum TaxID=1823 RepID=UPI001893CDEA|nr:catalase [Nocardia otitidiscaviarum]MBF6236433.1 catalase [Nocardia otitidiscaviarum]
MTDDTLTPDELTDRIAAVLAAAPGRRMLHQRGVTVVGHFRAEPVARTLSSAALFSGEEIAVIARFSGTRGDSHDAETGDQGLSVRFVPASAEPTDLITFTLPVFFVRSGADMLEFLTAVSAGPDSPEAMADFRRRHPESHAALDRGSGGAPGSYAGQRYYSVHAFGLTGRGGGTTWARLEWHPDATVEPLGGDESITLAADYLTDELDSRLPTVMTLHARLPRDGDPVHDPTALWADPPRLLELGRMTLQTRTADADLDFDPVRIAPGITAPLDRLAADRSAIYRLARARRRAAAAVTGAQPQHHSSIPSNPKDIER